MDHLPQLFTSLRAIECWLNAHANDKVARRLNHWAYILESRRLLLKQIIKLQIREFNRDG